MFSKDGYDFSEMGEEDEVGTYLSLLSYNYSVFHGFSSNYGRVNLIFHLTICLFLMVVSYNFSHL